LVPGETAFDTDVGDDDKQGCLQPVLTQHWIDVRVEVRISAVEGQGEPVGRNGSLRLVAGDHVLHEHGLVAVGRDEVHLALEQRALDGRLAGRAGAFVDHRVIHEDGRARGSRMDQTRQPDRDDHEAQCRRDQHPSDSVGCGRHRPGG